MAEQKRRATKRGFRLERALLEFINREGHDFRDTARLETALFDDRYPALAGKTPHARLAIIVSNAFLRDGSLRVSGIREKFAEAFGIYVRNLILYDKDPWKVIELFARTVRQEGLDAAIKKDSWYPDDSASRVANALIGFVQKENRLPTSHREFDQYANPSFRVPGETLRRGLEEIGEFIGTDLTRRLRGKRGPKPKG